MNRPKAYRWSEAMAANIEAHRQHLKVKSDKEAVEDLIHRGLSSIATSGSESAERHATMNEVRALRKKMDEIAVQLAAAQGADAIKQALADVKAAGDRIEDLLRQADTVTGIVADIQRSQKEQRDLLEFARLLDLWSSAYNRAIVSVVQEGLVQHFKDYLRLIDAGKSLLRRLGIGNSIEQEIKVQRQLL